jgi:hypothetical protein
MVYLLLLLLSRIPGASALGGRILSRNREGEPPLHQEPGQVLGEVLNALVHPAVAGDVYRCQYLHSFHSLLLICR